MKCHTKYFPSTETNSRMCVSYTFACLPYYHTYRRWVHIFHVKLCVKIACFPHFKSPLFHWMSPIMLLIILFSCTRAFVHTYRFPSINTSHLIHSFSLSADMRFNSLHSRLSQSNVCYACAHMTRSPIHTLYCSTSHHITLFDDMKGYDSIYYTLQLLNISQSNVNKHNAIYCHRIAFRPCVSHCKCTIPYANYNWMNICINHIIGYK